MVGEQTAVGQVEELSFRVKSDAGKGFVRNLECEASN